MKFRQDFIPLLDRTIDDPTVGRLCQRTANPVGRPLLNFSSPRSDGQGMLWIEPISGTVVDYEEQGVSYFVDRVTGARLEDFHQWNGRFTPETHAARIVLARASRLRILALETWLPAFLLVLAIILLTVKAWQAIIAKAARGRQVGDLASLQGLKDEEEA